MTIVLLSLTVLQQVYLYISIAASAILIIQFILALLGVGQHDCDTDCDTDADTEFDHDGGLRILTVRGVISFLAAGGWTGFTLAMADAHIAVITTVSLIVGLIALVGVAFLFKLIIKLQYDGTMRLENAIGRVAEVYLPIGAESSSIGKITVEVQGKLMEVEAVTLGSKAFKVGDRVKVSSMQSDSLFVVEELKMLAE